MISFILPFYHKAELFKSAFRWNAAYWEEDTELVCVLDEPSDEAAVRAMAQVTPDVKWKIIVNDVDHAWRPPCIPYNIGLRHATGSHVVLFDPESILLLPYPRYLHSLAANSFQWMFSGLAWHVPSPLDGVGEASLLYRCLRASQVTAPCFWGYGMLMAPKYDLEQICGYDESRTVYGHDDNDIRNRLTKYGVPCQIDPAIHVFHLWHDNPFDRKDPLLPTSPNTVLTNQKDTWGKAYSRIAYDWNHTNPITECTVPSNGLITSSSTPNTL